VLAPGPADSLVVDDSVAAQRANYQTQASTAALERQLGRRTSIDFNFDYSRSEYATQRGVETMGGGGHLRFGLTKGLALRLGYVYRDASLGYTAAGGQHDTTHFIQHNADAGIDFNRSLSLTRRTKFTASSGSAAIVEAGRTFYNVTGNARLTHELGRTWLASLAYSRSLSLVDQFAQPFFADGVTVGTSGLLSRRVQFTAAATGTFGQVGVAATSSGYRSYTGTTGITLAMSRHLAVAMDYAYYAYQFEPGTIMPAGFDRMLNRNTLRAYLTLWAPLMHRARRPDAAR
jgi:outer membrane protein assembly factor BamA